VKASEVEDVDFVSEFEKLTEDIGILNAEAHELEEMIELNSRRLLGETQ
jgi:hypothetical protein